MKTIGVSAVVLASAAFAPAAVVFDGSSSPIAQGWTRYATGGLAEGTSDGNVFTINTVGTSAAGARTSAFDLYSKYFPEVAAGGYEVVMRVRVPTAASNTLDGSAVLMVGGNATGFGDSVARSGMVIFTPTAVQWGDLTQSATNDATQFHTYRLSVTAAGVATFYVDDVQRLERTNYTSAGYVAFGDQTNDPNVDGQMDIDSVSVSAIPEPASLALMGVVGAGMMRRRRS